tara:strand:- start:123 stop:311 length:189 start_codon:yes stop_codon:yes gene_type:complete
MSTRIFENARFIRYEGDTIDSGISVLIDGVMTVVPIEMSNRSYSEIMQLVEAGDLVIAPADE